MCYIAIIVFFTVISVEQINRTSSSDLHFPINTDLVNYTASTDFSSEITIPLSFVDETIRKMNIIYYYE